MNLHALILSLHLVFGSSDSWMLWEARVEITVPLESRGSAHDVFATRQLQGTEPDTQPIPDCLIDCEPSNDAGDDIP